MSGDYVLSRGIGGHHRPNDGRSDEWLTPPRIIEALGAFDLDPCSPINRPWSTAANHFTIEDDGLERKWTGRVWLNPPYGTKTDHWLKKMARHNNGIALIFARTETEMFWNHVWQRATALLFIRGRINFYSVDGIRADKDSGGPSVLIAYNDDNAAALLRAQEAGAIHGYFVRLRSGAK